MKVKAAVIHNAGDAFKIEEVELADPRENEVKVKIVACGVAQTQHMEMDSWTKHFISKSWTALLMGEAIPQEFIPEAIELFKSGNFPFDKMIKFFKFEEINEAFEASHNGSVIKPVLIIDESYSV